MSPKKLNTYQSEFKESAVKLAIESGHPVAQTAKELGIPVNTLHTWIGKYSKRMESQMVISTHHFDEIKQLKKELARVTQERDLLKKAAAYFAKESQ
jgi:transposase